ncbi:MAG: methylation-associated defense system protein MAD4 [Isosphaeraceae bacterium]
MSDLIVLVPDRNMEASIRGLLGRYKALGIRQVASRILVHPSRDPGCLGEGHVFLRSFHRQYRHALILLDHDGCGRERETRASLEKSIEERLATSGWSERARAIVIDPELEVWVWSDSPHIPAALGSSDDLAGLRRLLRDQGLWREGQPKPDDPKLAMERILRLNNRPRSSAIYEELARKVSLKNCLDGAFAKLRTTLAEWFPV